MTKELSWRSKFLNKSPFKNGDNDKWGPGSRADHEAKDLVIHSNKPTIDKTNVDDDDYESLNIEIIDDRTEEEKSNDEKRKREKDPRKQLY